MDPFTLHQRRFENFIDPSFGADEIARSAGPVRANEQRIHAVNLATSAARELEALRDLDADRAGRLAQQWREEGERRQIDARVLNAALGED